MIKSNSILWALTASPTRVDHRDVTEAAAHPAVNRGERSVVNQLQSTQKATTGNGLPIGNSRPLGVYGAQHVCANGGIVHVSCSLAPSYKTNIWHIIIFIPDQRNEKELFRIMQSVPNNLNTGSVNAYPIVSRYTSGVYRKMASTATNTDAKLCRSSVSTG